MPGTSPSPPARDSSIGGAPRATAAPPAPDLFATDGQAGTDPFPGLFLRPNGRSPGPVGALTTPGGVAGREGSGSRSNRDRARNRAGSMVGAATGHRTTGGAGRIVGAEAAAAPAVRPLPRNRFLPMFVAASASFRLGNGAAVFAVRGPTTAAADRDDPATFAAPTMVEARGTRILDAGREGRPPKPVRLAAPPVRGPDELGDLALPSIALRPATASATPAARAGARPGSRR